MLALPLPALRPGAEVRLEIRDAAPRKNVRTFTLWAGRTRRHATRKLALEMP